MKIRHTTAADLDAVLQIYAEARDFMSASGNPTQWKDWYPPREIIEHDIEVGTGHVCVDDEDNILAVFYFNIERDETYETIEDGEWLDGEPTAPCGVVHRIASRAKGAGTFCIEWCFEQCGNLKIDTHEDNKPMQRVLEKLGFTYCGIIWVLDHTEPRIAFQRIR